MPLGLQAGISPALTFRAGASQVPVQSPPPWWAGCSWEGGGRRRSLSDFVGQPWPRRRQHQRSGERRDARRASRSGRWGPCERAQARPGARRAAACPRAAAPGRAPGGPPTTTGCCGGPGCSDRGAAPAAGPGPPGVGATPTPDPTGPATPTSSPDALGFQGPGILFFFFLHLGPPHPLPCSCPLLCPLDPHYPSFSFILHTHGETEAQV